MAKLSVAVCVSFIFSFAVASTSIAQTSATPSSYCQKLSNNWEYENKQLQQMLIDGARYILSSTKEHFEAWCTYQKLFEARQKAKLDLEKKLIFECNKFFTTGNNERITRGNYQSHRDRLLANPESARSLTCNRAEELAVAERTLANDEALAKACIAITRKGATNFYELQNNCAYSVRLVATTRIKDNSLFRLALVTDEVDRGFIIQSYNDFKPEVIWACQDRKDKCTDSEQERIQADK